MAINVREAEPDEADALSELAVRSKGYWGYSDAFLEACRDELRVRPEWFAGNASDIFVAADAGKIAGYYALERIDDEVVELQALFVEPESIGQGIGRVLIEHAVIRAKAIGGRRLLIQGDPHAKAFYTAVGGRQVGQRVSESIPGRFLPLIEISL